MLSSDEWDTMVAHALQSVIARHAKALNGLREIEEYERYSQTHDYVHIDD